MKTLKGIIALILLIVTFCGCDEIEQPIIELGSYRSDLYGPAPTFNTTTSVTKRILIEDFTGHDCGNCPIGHQIAHDILSANPERVAVVAVHAGTLAEPLPPEFPADWRTEEGIYYLLTQVGADLMPTGRINRLPAANVAFSPSTWVAKSNAELSTSSPVNLQMDVSFSAENQHLNVHVNEQWFEAAGGDYRLVILVTESQIVAPQLWYGHDPEFVEEYDHEHMLRGSLTGATGFGVASNPAVGDNHTQSYTSDWNSSWVPENCEVIAFVTEGEGGRVLNVVKQPVIPE